MQCNGTSFLSDWESNIGDVTRCMVFVLITAVPWHWVRSSAVFLKKNTTFRELEQGGKFIKRDKTELINRIGYAATFVLMWILTGLLRLIRRATRRFQKTSCHNMYCIVSLHYFKCHFNGSFLKVDVLKTLLQNILLAFSYQTS